MPKLAYVLSLSGRKDTIERPWSWRLWENSVRYCRTQQLFAMIYALHILACRVLQALASYEQAAKLQSTAEFKSKIASLKKQIQREKAGGGRKAADKENNGKTASSFAFTEGRRNAESTDNNKASSKVLAAPNVGEIKNDADYAEAKKGMVRLQYADFS